MTRRLPLLLALFSLLLLPAGGAHAQAAPLEPFVERVARLWAAGDAAGLVELAPADGRILLDLGEGTSGAVHERHAAAALRQLFSGRRTEAVRATRVRLAGGQPPGGFGELTWVSLPEGVTVPVRATVYVGAVWEAGGWRVREMRILR